MGTDDRSDQRDMTPPVSYYGLSMAVIAVTMRDQRDEARAVARRLLAERDAAVAALGRCDVDRREATRMYDDVVTDLAEMTTERDAARAEVAELTGDWNSLYNVTQEWHTLAERCKAALERYQQAMGLVSTLAPDMEMDPANPVGMAQTVVNRCKDWQAAVVFHGDRHAALHALCQRGVPLLKHYAALEGDRVCGELCPDAAKCASLSAWDSSCDDDSDLARDLAAEMEAQGKEG